MSTKSDKKSRFNLLNFRITSVDKYQLDENDPLLKRLNTVITRLEGLVKIDSVSGPTPGMIAFKKLIDNQLESFLGLSKSVGLDVKKQSIVIKEAFEEEYKILSLTADCCQPKKEDMGKLCTNLNKSLEKIIAFVPTDRTKLYYHELTTIADSVLMLSWLNIFDPVTFSEDILIGAQTYSNKVVQNCLDRRQKHVEWVRSWLAVLQGLCTIIKRYYAGGLRWKSQKEGKYPPIPKIEDESSSNLNKTGSIKKPIKEESKSKKFVFKPMKAFNRGDLLSEIANAKRNLNLKHVPASSRAQ